jgi:hypothetical protein
MYRRKEEGMIDQEKNEKKPVDFLKVVEGIRKSKEEETKEGFKVMRDFYLQLREADFSMEEAMAFNAALAQKKNKEEQK